VHPFSLSSFRPEILDRLSIPISLIPEQFDKSRFVNAGQCDEINSTAVSLAKPFKVMLLRKFHTQHFHALLTVAQFLISFSAKYSNIHSSISLGIASDKGGSIDLQREFSVLIRLVEAVSVVQSTSKRRFELYISSWGIKLIGLSGRFVL